MEETKRFCNYCGAEIASNSVFCNVCGKKIKIIKKKENNNGEGQSLTAVDVINRILVFAVALMGFIALSVSLLRASSTSANARINGYFTLDFLFSTNSLDVWLTLSSIIIIVATSLMSLTLIISVICGKFNKTILHFVFITSLVLGLIYLINGFVCLSKMETVIAILFVEDIGSFKATTLAYIPFAIQAVLYGVYWIIWACTRNKY